MRRREPDCDISLSRTVWENGQAVLDDLEWERLPDGTWISSEGPSGRKLTFADVLEELVRAVRSADASVAGRSADELIATRDE